MIYSITRTAAAALALFALGTGCVSPERKPAVTAISSLADTRSELVAGKTDIDDALVAIGELEARPANLTPPYNRYKDAVAAVGRRARAVSERVQDMRLRSADYRASWSQENAQITDATVRATAEERRERVASRYDSIDRDAQALRAAYDPFITKLRDLQTVLANDLTYPGIQSAKPAFDDIRVTATSLRSKVDAVVANIDESTMRLAPSTKPTN